MTDILDRETYTHQARLLRALHAAQPIEHEGRKQFIHTISAQQSGGAIDMTVYLAGDATPVDSTEIHIPVAAGANEK